jgi:threonine synthase
MEAVVVPVVEAAAMDVVAAKEENVVAILVPTSISAMEQALVEGIRVVTMEEAQDRCARFALKLCRI